jgi:hypothetical protein
VAADFFTVYTLWGSVLYVLFFIELSTRKVHVAGCTENPDREWVTEQARNFILGRRSQAATQIPDPRAGRQVRLSLRRDLRDPGPCP